MSQLIAGVEFRSVMIVDDDEQARQGYRYPIEELELSAEVVDGPIQAIDSFVSGISTDGVLCDYHLRKKSYATFNGDELAMALYLHEKPVVMCTAFTDSDVLIFRRYRRYIPCLLKPHDVDPDNIVRGFELCIDEFNGRFGDRRKPWRALVRIDEKEEEGDYVYVVVPSWDSDKKVRVYMSDFPTHLTSIVEEGRRLHAMVNLGAERHDELYFFDWESE